jgi:hypothetical protein
VNPWVNVPLCESVLVTTTFAAPAECAGVVAVIDVPLCTVTPVADVPPSFTVAPDWNPVPVIVTPVPPFVVPALGEMELTVGAGAVPPLVTRTELDTDGTPSLFRRNSM